MTDLHARLALKARLPRTWPAFFERHGTFTAAQLLSIPLLLDGQNVMLCAPTASGKTEAALAPLIERHCPPVARRPSLHILYLTPTRALVNDLHSRLAHPLDTLGITLGVKTRDTSTMRASRPADVLITTPESVDSLLTTQAKLFANLRAIVLDELHLFDGTPRGDQLRALLSRIRAIRAYAGERGDAPDTAVQYVALSATIAEPEAAAARYFAGAQVVRAPGDRRIEAEQIALADESAAALIDYLAAFRAHGQRKALVFCNSRAEVEGYAAATRARSPFGSAVFVHYSNIEPKRRREIERQFAEAEAAICFASSTLELGIDVGNIDVVILIGPPGSAEAFVQRVGRGNRRRGTSHVACFYRTPLERLLFDALLDDRRPTTDDRRPTTASGLSEVEGGELRSTASETQHSKLTTQNSSFRPAVAVQQIFSLIKQSPTVSIRLAELTRLFDGMLAPQDLEAIVGELQQRDYLKVGRPGEWRAGERLNQLFDEQAGEQVELSIHSNIPLGGQRLIDIRDQHTQRTVARVDALWLDRETLTLEGRPLNVEWCDGEAIWVSSQQTHDRAERLIYRSERQLLSYDLARRLPARLGLEPGAAPFVIAPEGCWWYHWLGDLYGRAALDLMRYQVAAVETPQIGLCLQLPDEPRAPPEWTEAQVVRYLEDNYRAYEPLLALGPFQHLLPLRLRRRAVVEQFDVGRFLRAVAALRPVAAPEGLSEDLIALVVP